MTISDVIETIVVYALIFFPPGYLARHSLRHTRDTLRLFFARPCYAKPAGTLRRMEKVRAIKKRLNLRKMSPCLLPFGNTGAASPAGTSIFWLSLARYGRDVSAPIRSSIWYLLHLRRRPLHATAYIACATGLLCRPALLCSDMTPGCLVREA